jgi:hypothetical protein
MEKQNNTENSKVVLTVKGTTVDLEKQYYFDLSFMNIVYIKDTEDLTENGCVICYFVLDAKKFFFVDIKGMKASEVAKKIGWVTQKA